MAFVADLEVPVLSGEDRHHFARVLRVRDGEPMVVCDGTGGWRTARFSTELDDLGPARHQPARAPRLIVAFALIKGDRPEMVVQKLTELGIDRIIPFTSDHTVVRWDAARSDRQHQRYERIAREASMQCRRTHLPEIASPTTFVDVVSTSSPALLADADGRRLWATEPGASAVTRVAGAEEVTVLIGPEGGWSPEERTVGLPSVRIADHVLRAETASIAAGALLTALRASGQSDEHPDWKSADNGG